MIRTLATTRTTKMIVAAKDTNAATRNLLVGNFWVCSRNNSCRFNRSLGRFKSKAITQHTPQKVLPIPTAERTRIGLTLLTRTAPGSAWARIIRLKICYFCSSSDCTVMLSPFTSPVTLTFQSLSLSVLAMNCLAVALPALSNLITLLSAVSRA